MFEAWIYNMPGKFENLGMFLEFGQVVSEVGFYPANKHFKKHSAGAQIEPLPNNKNIAKMLRPMAMQPIN